MGGLIFLLVLAALVLTPIVFMLRHRANDRKRKAKEHTSYEEHQRYLRSPEFWGNSSSDTSKTSSSVCEATPLTARFDATQHADAFAPVLKPYLNENIWGPEVAEIKDQIDTQLQLNDDAIEALTVPEKVEALQERKTFLAIVKAPYLERWQALDHEVTSRLNKPGGLPQDFEQYHTEKERNGTIVDIIQGYEKKIDEQLSSL